MRSRRVITEKYGILERQPGVGETKTLYDATRFPRDKHRVRLSYVDPSSRSFTCILEHQDKTEVYRMAVPTNSTFQYHIYLWRANGSFELEEYNRGTNVLVRRLLVSLSTDPNHQGLVVDIFDVIRGIVKNMDWAVVTYYNDARRRPAQTTTRSAGSLVYNLRQLTLPDNLEYRPWFLAYLEPKVKIYLTENLARAATRRQLEICTSGKIIAVDCQRGHYGVKAAAQYRRALAPAAAATATATATATAAPPAPTPTPATATAITIAPAPAPALPTAMSAPTRCAACLKDESPLSFAAIKNKYHRRTWVGCQKGDRCLSRNYWFHTKCSDSEDRFLSSNRNLGWLCPECRIVVPPGTRLRDGMYMRI